MGSFELQRAPTTAAGDFDQNGLYECADIDALFAEIAADSQAEPFDLNGDGIVDLDDRDAWLLEAGAFHLPSGTAHPLGDANLDGSVNATDLNVLGMNWQDNAGSWCGGDFDGDGRINANDLNLLGLNWQIDISAMASPPLERVPRAALELRLDTVVRNNLADSRGEFESQDIETSHVDLISKRVRFAATLRQRCRKMTVGWPPKEVGVQSFQGSHENGNEKGNEKDRHSDVTSSGMSRLLAVSQQSRHGASPLSR